LRHGGLALALLVIVAMVGGCEVKSWVDPSELGRFDHKPLVVPILKNLDVGIEENDARFTSATEVRAGDLKVTPADYVIGAWDLVSVSVTGLVVENLETIKTMRVSEGGMISLPMVGQIKAAGLTESQLEQSIVQTLRDRQLMANATVSVVTVEARNRTYSIFGSVSAPGQYQILESNTRLLDALVSARGETQSVGVEYIYIIRRKDQDSPEDTPAAPAPGAAPSGPSPDALAPRTAVPANQMPTTPIMLQAQPAPETEGRTVTIEGQPMQIQGGQMVPANGQPAAPGAVETTTPASGAFEFNALPEPDDVRVIRVPFGPLQRGELRYNVVIRPRDMIWIPSPIIGEYYMGGHILRTGVYSLTARDITLRNAVISAGGVDSLAIPERTDLVRKVERFKKVYVRVNLAKIFSGEEPDILLKPDDEIYVGTNALAPFLAAFRSAFRITYGFGFIYDRNYYDATNQN
jgi:polysaccharide export outer membrane protein